MNKRRGEIPACDVIIGLAAGAVCGLKPLARIKPVTKFAPFTTL